MPTNHNPLLKLESLGQSIWLDSIRRGQILSGELAKLRDQDGLSGETANPTIFDKAISGSHDYDELIRDLVHAGKSSLEIYETLAIQDVQMACDVFRPIYDKTKGADGFVSIEVSPKLAHDTQGTIAEAKRFFREVNRPNVMVKIPGTKEGAPAIEECLYSGVNINITLLFSIRAHEEVAWAYIRALERRAAEGKPIDRIASVASFFVSRIDTLADKMLSDKLKATKDPSLAAKLEALGGKVAIANAKMAYQLFKRVFSDPRFLALKKNGARVQRPLWASTSTKNPNYPDTLYVDHLIGTDTVNTLPLETIDAFRNRGKPRVTIEEDLTGAEQVLSDLSQVGLSLDGITSQVLDEGVDKFADSLDSLLGSIEKKRAMTRREDAMRQSAWLGAYQREIEAALAQANETQTVKRIWQRDPFLWKPDPKDHVELADRLGWLTVAADMKKQVDDLSAFADQVRREGIRDIVLCGIGGSALCVQVLSVTFGSASGFPAIHVFDTIDPGSIRSLERKIDPKKTLFVIASKSGGTTETLTQFEYFHSRVSDGKRFVAITDAGSKLEKIARENHFHRVFLNPSDIGGRFSALSYFGLVPAALGGIDIAKLLDRATEMQRACENQRAEGNPGAWLGVAFAELAKLGRDKITIVTTPRVDMFGVWAEQLIAESTGKEGKGLVPIDREPLGEPSVYGNDRIFVYLKLDGAKNAVVERRLEELQAAGHPVVELKLRDTYDIGAEFFRWEFAIAVAGARMQINAFDQPNVQESKDNTRRVLEQPIQAAPEPVWEDKSFTLYSTEKMTPKSLREGLRAYFQIVHPGDYFAIMAYMQEAEKNHVALQSMRIAARDSLKIATTLGYAPHFLHSTGQLHKGGPNDILALQITTDSSTDVKIPGEKFSFGDLRRAQSIGDWQSLVNHGRRAMGVHLKRGADIQRLALEFNAALGAKAKISKRSIRKT
jgi:transaldolase / glucose-6-phosphate isomerase